MNGKGIMSFTCLILDRWLFVKRRNTGFTEEAVIEKSYYKKVEDKLDLVNIQNSFFLD